MYNSILLFFVLSIVAVGCTKNQVEPTETIEGNVLYQVVNDTIFASNLSKTIALDVNSDEREDLVFEIINLKDYNSPDFSEPDTLAARVQTPTTLLIDNSGYGYPDALSAEASIWINNAWVKRENSVLGTIHSGGSFGVKGKSTLDFVSSQKTRLITVG